jgi:uncharacterized protein
VTRSAVAVTIEVPVKPTEDPGKVMEAVRQIFPEAELHHEEEAIVGHANTIATLLKKAGDERVLDAARGTLWRGRQGEKATRFQVNKQAALMGRLNFNEVTHPLGDIIVKIQTDDLNQLLDEIAPPTRAELAQLEKMRATAQRRAEQHGEETHLARIGSAIDTGFEDEDEDEHHVYGEEE